MALHERSHLRATENLLDLGQIVELKRADLFERVLVSRLSAFEQPYNEFDAKCYAFASAVLFGALLDKRVWKEFFRAACAPVIANWFDQASATIGGEDLVTSVRRMLGNVARFDFNQVGNNIPKVDLPDLERFLRMELERQGKRPMKREEGLEVIAPEEWSKSDYAISKRYTGLVFDRNAPIDTKQAPTRLVGVGHSLFDRALNESLGREAFLIRCSRLEAPLLVATISDEVTGHGQTVSSIVIGVWRDAKGKVQVLRDWELLLQLNRIGSVDASLELPPLKVEDLEKLAAELEGHIVKLANEFAEGMTRPAVRGELLLMPDRQT